MNPDPKSMPEEPEKEFPSTPRKKTLREEGFEPDPDVEAPREHPPKK